MSFLDVSILLFAGLRPAALKSLSKAEKDATSLPSSLVGQGDTTPAQQPTIHRLHACFWLSVRFAPICVSASGRVCFMRGSFLTSPAAHGNIHGTAFSDSGLI